MIIYFKTPCFFFCGRPYIYINIGISAYPHVFLATSHTKNMKSEKTLKHTIQLIYQKKRYEHTLFLNVIIIAFTHKNNKNNKKR